PWYYLSFPTRRSTDLGGDDALLEAHQLLRTVAGLDFDLVGGHEFAGALHHLHLALLGHARQPLGELADHRFLVPAQLVERDPGLDRKSTRLNSSHVQS